MNVNGALSYSTYALQDLERALPALHAQGLTRTAQAQDQLTQLLHRAVKFNHACNEIERKFLLERDFVKENASSFECHLAVLGPRWLS